MSRQSKIEVEAHAGKLLRCMAQFGHCPCETITHAARWLLDRHYAYRSYGKLYMTESNPLAKTLTTSGRDYHDGLCRNPATTESAAAWKEEARSGMTTAPGKLGTITKQSDIQNAVIPRPSPPGPRKTPESIMQDNERDAAARKKWMADLDCTEEELTRYGAEGRIRMCSKCDSVGIFDRKGEGRFQSRCRKCNKQGGSHRGDNYEV